MSSERGACSFCESQSVVLVAPPQLRDVFGPLINIYEPEANGRLLVEWLREDWDLFHHVNMDDTRANALLAEVLDNQDIVHKPFVPSPKYKTDKLIVWERLRTELMHENRYFPATTIDLERLQELFDNLQAEQVPTVWYRARLQTAEGPFSLAEMGAPPRRTASHGRANPAGIPYLYLASALETSISEIRPHTGERACVAEFTLPSGLSFVDLQNPKRIVSPFVFTDEDLIGPLRDDVAFLDRLGEELTRPVIPQSAQFDYVPSQYVCEYIKKCGYHGVLYRSSVGSGINLALFNPSAATPSRITQYDVVRVVADVQQVRS